MSVRLGKRFATAPSLVAVIGALCAIAGAQDGVSTAGAARTKYLSGLGVIPASREVHVEDFVNYHRHEIGRPKAGEAVALDVRFGSATVAPGGEAILQVGMATALAHDRQQIRPVNLSLVIDKSGSMADADKLVRVKAAMQTLVSQLRPTDTLSIVLFDSEARVLLPAQKLADKDRVKRMIGEVEPGSSTNLNAGLMLGFEQAMRVRDPEATNRVVLLTDGIANQGVTDPELISRAAKEFLRKGIDLSTVGVGRDLNQDLLQELARSGRGLYHFVADPKDIEKVFVKELQSLLSPVAKAPTLEIRFGEGFVLEHVYGYEPRIGKDSVTIPLATMNSGMTEVVLLRLRARSVRASADSLRVSARLSFEDVEKGRKTVVSGDALVSVGGVGASGSLEDRSVAKNLAIAQLAQSIRDMAQRCEEQDCVRAEQTLRSAMGRTAEMYPNLEDEDLKRNLSIAQKYQEALLKEIESRGLSRAVGADRREPRPGPANLIPNGDFAFGNTGFTSERSYIDPSPNCLWGGYYTIAPAFNAPQLHTNIPNRAYSAPRGGQVFFMNSGTKEAYTLWSSTVSCQPRTKYRIRFYEIGLSGSPEYVNTYEIRVNGQRSEPQLGGDGKYVEIAFEWNSGSSTSATVSIRRLPQAHIGGIIGICNIEMVPFGEK